MASLRSRLLPDHYRWCPRCQAHQLFDGRFTLTRLITNIFLFSIDPNGETEVPFRRLRCTQCGLRIWRASRLLQTASPPAPTSPAR